MSRVELTFTPLPAHVRTARLVATAVARRGGVAESLLDEVRLAVGEACSRAVEAHRRHCPDEPIRLELSTGPRRFAVVVSDQAPDAQLAAHLAVDDALAVSPGGGPLDGLPAGIGLAVITGLADDVEVAPNAAGIDVRMSWPIEDTPDPAGTPG